ncbi:MAG: AraC family transcriptional regulator [Betaproteobacteria bacterium]|nr:AraC family transcriptional regulator [Betaproteobacteria bacterium]
MDALSTLFDRFPLSARLFYAGEICNTADFPASAGHGHLHIVKRGTLSFASERTTLLTVNEPAALFFPQPRDHRLVPVPGEPAEVLCASVQLGGTANNPFLKAFPDLLNVSLAESDTLAKGLDLLIEEAFGHGQGRQAALDRLTEFCLLLMMRHVVDQRKVEMGVLAGLSDARIAKAVIAVHEDPRRAWTLAAMAEIANLSRARFAARFKETTGVTPLDYLTDWRIGLAQSLMKHGRPLKLVAEEVGYASPATFSRIFAARVGKPPRAWLTAQTTSADGDQPA